MKLSSTRSQTAEPIYDSSRKRSAAIEELEEIFRYRNLVLQFTRRDILTRYKRSVLGIAWTMLTPLGTMLILTIVFSNAFKISMPGYAAYVLNGLIAWTFFSQTTHAATVHLVWGGALLNRIYVPRTVFAVSAVATGMLNLTISLIPLMIVTLIVGLPIRWTALLIPIPMLFLAMFAMGIGLCLSAIAIYFADVTEMYQILLTAWLYLSPVIWTEEQLPPSVSVFVRLNPMYYLINLFRIPIYEGRVPTLTEIAIPAVISIITLLVGWIYFSSRADEFAYRV
jgi:ABC-type polysaccharide/polyol phosphate export permease